MDFSGDMLVPRRVSWSFKSDGVEEGVSLFISGFSKTRFHVILSALINFRSNKNEISRLVASDPSILPCQLI